MVTRHRADPERALGKEFRNRAPEVASETWTPERIAATIARMMKLLAKALAVLVAVAALAGCANDPNSKYATPARGGWDNFRADSASGQPATLAALC